MDARAAALTLVSAFLFSGCVGEDAEPAAAATGADESSGPVPSVDELPEKVLESVDVPFSVDGEAPSGIWICSGVQTTGQCFTHVLDADSYIVEIPHDGSVVGLTARLTFSPVTPNIRGMVLMVQVGEELGDPILGEVEGQSGMELTITDVLVNATDTLAVLSWPTPDVNVAGPIWINPMPQPFRVEGSFTELREAD